jgi:hypothetical protein
VVSRAAASSDTRPFLLAGLALIVLVLGSATLLAVLAGARRRQEAFR